MAGGSLALVLLFLSRPERSLQSLVHGAGSKALHLLAHMELQGRNAMLLSLVGDGPFLRGLLLQEVPCNAAISVCATGTGVLPKTELAVRLLVEVEVVPSTGLAGLVYLEHPQVLSSILERLCFCSMGSVKSYDQVSNGSMPWRCCTTCARKGCSCLAGRACGLEPLFRPGILL